MRRDRWSIAIGRIAGIPIAIHLSFFALVLLVVLYPGPAGAGKALAWIVALFACVVVHELSHSIVARRLGGRVRSILLLPIGGASQITHLPSGCSNELAMAAAGPLASLLLAGLAAVAAVVGGQGLLPITLLGGPVFRGLMWLNAMLAGFNLLPAFPLDGGRIMRSALERRHSVETATRMAADAGRVAGAVMVAVGLLWDMWLVLIGLFVIWAAGAEQAATQLHVRLGGVRAATVMRAAGATLQAWWPLPLTAEGKGPWVVTEGQRYLGMADGRDLARRRRGTVRDVTDCSAEGLDPDEDMGDTGLNKVIAAGGACPVVDDGRVLGIVILSDLSAWMRPDVSRR